MIPLNKDLIELDVDVKTAEEAIRIAGSLLEKQNKIKTSYIDAMVKGYHEIGPYIVLAPGIAIPHARPEYGVNETCISVIRLKNETVFGHPTNDPVKLVCAIGGVDNISHIGMLQALSSVLGNQEKYQKLLEETSKENFLKLFE